MAVASAEVSVRSHLLARSWRGGRGRGGPVWRGQSGPRL